MSWRPDFDKWWQENHNRPWEDGGGLYSADAQFIWDACADAMLEALKERGYKIHEGDRASIPIKAPCWLVTIPDEEGEG